MQPLPPPTFAEKMRFLWFQILLIFSYLTERIEVLIRKDHIEAPEMLSIGCCVCFDIPMLLKSDYLAASVYMSVLAATIGQPAVMVVYFVLGLIELFLVLLGGEPSPFIKNERDKRRWLIYRMCGLLLSAVIWAGTAVFFSAYSLTFGTFCFGALSLWCVLWCWRLAFVYKVFSDVARELPEIDSMLFASRSPASILP